MAWYPDAVRKQLTVPNRARNRVAMTPRRINLHTAVSNSTSIFPFFNSAGANGVFSHFYVRKDGTVEQYQDTAYRASCDLDGNPDTISIETWDGYGKDWTTTPPPWNAAQIASMVDLLRWLWSTHPTIPRRIAKDNRIGSTSHGLSWHRLGVIGAPGFVPRPAGLQYSLARGKVCPGPARMAQIPGLFAAVNTEVQSAPAKPAASTPTAGGLTMSEVAAITAKLDTISAQLRHVAEITGSRDALNARAAETQGIIRRELATLDVSGAVREAVAGLDLSGVDGDKLAEAVVDRIAQKLGA